MSSMSWANMPFKYRGESDFFIQLDKWIGDVFYEQLPLLGYETREEQIYTTYHIVKALRERAVLFGEAGSGTGKTFAYILTCLCYARLKGMPVVLSSASPVLQEQLTHPHGDIATLSRTLGLNIDARLAKSPEHYLCEVKVERLKWVPKHRERQKVLAWAENSTYGDRSELPHISDATWSQVAWDSGLRCDRCKRKGYCRFAKARRQFQGAKDFIVCEHQVFFNDLWDREELKLRRMVPYLPDYAAVVLDEGHLVELPIAKTLGRELNQATIKNIITDLSGLDGLRMTLLEKMEETEARARRFFTTLTHAVVVDQRAERMHINRVIELMDAAQLLSNVVEAFQDELMIEESMNEQTPYALALASHQDRLDQLRQGLRLLQSGEEHSVAWWEPEDSSAYVIPREYSQQLHTELLSKHIPVLFTSSTLAAGKSFDYMHHITGAMDAIHSQVGVPFNLHEQVACYVALDLPHNDDYLRSAAIRIKELLAITEGRTLILCSSPVDRSNIVAHLSQQDLPYRLLWEGQASRTKLLDEFRSDTTSVLVGNSFWEGVDVPGESLSQIIVLTLPFPRHDPLVEARRREAREKGLDPTETVDVPSMLIKLRQGFGRLIRTSVDRGLISVLDSGPNTETFDRVIEAIPKQIEVTHDLAEAKERTRKLLAQGS
ncbi:MAG: ATP-dependent DNA helicase [Peptococcaceae bacterium]|nr:ATP-dependent DNA helicase [Peptococcaceae bacterium]